MDLSSIRIREHFGLLSNDSHISQFTFLVSPPKNRSGIEKNDYVLVDHPLLGEACQILAIIADIASYEEIAGSTINERKGKMLATAQVIGSIDLKKDNKPLKEVLVPPNPGSRVYIPLKSFLQDILNRNLKGEAYKKPIEVGTLEGSSVEEQNSSGAIPCFLDAEDLLNKHTIITGVGGIGKTHISRWLAKAMAKKTSAKIVVFDSYREYVNTLNEDASTTALTSKIDKDSIAKAIKNQLTILDASKLSAEERPSCYMDWLQQLLKYKSDAKIGPVIVIVEEAESLDRDKLNQVVAEGRKRGVFLILTASHPSDLGGKILSQMGNQIIGRTTDPTDIECLVNMSGTEKTSLSNLVLGEWIINGINASRPMKMHIG